MSRKHNEAFLCGGAGEVITKKTPRVPAVAQPEHGFTKVLCPMLGETVPVRVKFGTELRRKCKMNGGVCPYDTRPY